MLDHRVGSLSDYDTFVKYLKVASPINQVQKFYFLRPK
jgi:hypothetical protein